LFNKATIHDISDQVEEFIETEILQKEQINSPVPTKTRKEKKKLKAVVAEFDILSAVKNMKADVTMGVLLHDNPSYRKQLKPLLICGKGKVQLPAVFSSQYGVKYPAPTIKIEIAGEEVCNVPIDGGAAINVIMEDFARQLGFTKFQFTNQILRLADQSRTFPVGELGPIPVRIGGQIFKLHFTVIKPIGKPYFQAMLGRPWLYDADAIMDYSKHMVIFGHPRTELPWMEDTFPMDDLEEQHQSEVLMRKDGKVGTMELMLDVMKEVDLRYIEIHEISTNAEK
jgi:hypothetical protein